MPVIPGYQEKSGVLTDRPIGPDINPERFGKDAAALSEVGGAVGELGSRLMQARKVAEESDAVAQAHHDDTLWLAQQENDLRLNYNKNAPNIGSPTLAPYGGQNQGASMSDLSTPVLDQDTDPNGRGPASDDVSQPAPKEVLTNLSTANYDVSGFSDELKKRIDDRVQGQMKAMPTGDAQRKYLATVQPMFDKSYAQGLDWENTTKARNYLENISIRYNASAQFLANNPSLDNANNLLDGLREDLNSKIGTVITADDAQKLYRIYGRQYVMTLFDGYAKSPETAKNGMDILNSISETAPRDKKGNLILRNAPSPQQLLESNGLLRKIEFGPGVDPGIVSSVLLPTDIPAIQGKLDHVVKTGNATKLGDLERAMQDYEHGLSSGDPSYLQKNFDLDQATKNVNLIQQAAKDQSISQDVADRYRMNLTFGISAKKVMDQLYTMPANQKDKFDQLLSNEFESQRMLMNQQDKSWDIGTKYKIQDHIDKMWDRVQDARIKHPADYVEMFMGKNLPPLNGNIPSEARLDKRRQYMQQLGMGQGNVLTDSEKSNYQSQLKKAADENPEAAAQFLSGLRRRTGRYANEVFDELNDGKGKLDDFFRTASYMSSDEASAAVIGNSKFRKQIDEGFKNQFGKDEEKALNEALTENFKDRYNAFASTGSFAKNIGFANSLYNQVGLEAKRMMINDGMSRNDALVQAQKKLVDDHYHIIGKTFVPKQIGDTSINPNYIEGEMQKVYDPKWAASNGVSLPGGQVEKDPNVQQRSLDLAIKGGRWATNPNGLSGTFMVQLTNKKWVPLVKKDGKPITIDYGQSSINPSKEAIDYNTTPLDRFFR